MKYGKNLLAALAVLLCSAGAIFLPAHLSGLRDEEQYDRVSLTSLPALPAAPKTMGSAEKMALIAAYSTSEASVFMKENPPQAGESSSSGNVLPVYFEELYELQKLRLFPNYDFRSGLLSFRTDTLTYGDALSLSRTVTVWVVSLHYRSGEITFTMDAETHRIYRYRIDSAELLNAVSSLGFLSDWGRYLGIEIQESAEEPASSGSRSGSGTVFTGIFTAGEKKCGVSFSLSVDDKICSVSTDFFLY